MKTRKTLLLNLSAPQFGALSSSPVPCAYCDAGTSKRLEARGLIETGLSGAPTLTPFGAAAVAAYRAAEAAGLLKDVA